MLLVFDRVLTADGKCPCLSKRVDQAGIGDIGHAAVELLLIERHIGQILRALGHATVNPIAVTRAHVRAQVGLIDGKALLNAQVDHAAELTRHTGVVRLVPALAIGKLPMSIAQPKERRAIRIGKHMRIVRNADKTVAVQIEFAGVRHGLDVARAAIKAGLLGSLDNVAPSAELGRGKRHAIDTLAVPVGLTADYPAARTGKLRPNLNIQKRVVERTGALERQNNRTPHLGSSILIQRHIHCRPLSGLGTY